MYAMKQMHMIYLFESSLSSPSSSMMLEIVRTCLAQKRNHVNASEHYRPNTGARDDNRLLPIPISQLEA